jgi:PAS domain S-box-containing protein
MESEERYRALVESSSDHIFLLGCDGVYLFSNDQVGHLGLGSGRLLVGHPLRDVYPPGGADFYEEQLQRVLITGRAVDIEYSLAEPGGPYYRLDTLYPLHRGLEVWAVGGIGRDITARKRAEEKLKKAHDELEKRVEERTAELRRGHQRLQTLSQRLVEVQETERRRLARELHDEIGQALTGLKLLLEMSVRLSADGTRGPLAEALGLVHELMGQVRELSLDLRPAMLDDLGLLPALLWHLERYQTQTQVQIDFRHSGVEGRRFAPEMETAAYRLAQEALTNVARHAGVCEAQVRVWADQDTLGLRIADRGKGFDPDLALAAGTTSGLIGMRERAVLLGGQLTIESAPGEGTCVTAEWPLEGREMRDEG